MGKIFLIEPHRVLQQAIALSLFPEHDVRVANAADPSTIAALNEIDLLIIDAAALREGGHLSPEMNRAIQSSSIPTVWIDDDDSSLPPKRDKLAVVLKPIESGALQSALAGLLAPASARKERKTPTRKAKAGREPELIDLVEVVEEEPPSEDRESPEKPR
jgi:hypothetical protein